MTPWWTSLRRFNKDGKVKSESSFSAGKPQGIVRQYYEDGALHEEANYVDGILDGVQKVLLPGWHPFH